MVVRSSKFSPFFSFFFLQPIQDSAKVLSSQGFTKFRVGASTLNFVSEGNMVAGEREIRGCPSSRLNLATEPSSTPSPYQVSSPTHILNHEGKIFPIRFFATTLAMVRMVLLKTSFSDAQVKVATVHCQTCSKTILRWFREDGRHLHIETLTIKHAQIATNHYVRAGDSLSAL